MVTVFESSFEVRYYKMRQERSQVGSNAFDKWFVTAKKTELH